MKGAAQEMQRESTSRMELIDEAAQASCSSENCEWLSSALQVLRYNNINPPRIWRVSAGFVVKRSL